MKELRLAGISTMQAGNAFLPAFIADSDEAGHAFQYEAGHLFRSEAGQRSDLMSATGVVLLQIDLDDVCAWTRSSGFEFRGRRAALAQALAGELRSDRRCG